MTASDPFARSSWILTLASIAVVIAALYLGKGVLLPVTLAVVLSFLLTPVCDWFERLRLGRIPAVLVTVTLSVAALGVAIAMGGLGSLIGAVLTGRVTNRLGVGRTLILMLIIRGGFAFFTPLAGIAPLSPIAMLMIAQLCGDALQEIYMITQVSLRQTLTPDRLLGRVSASIQLLVMCIAPLGALVGGGLAEVAGVRLTLLIACGGFLLAAGWVISSPVRDLRAQPEKDAVSA